MSTTANRMVSELMHQPVFAVGPAASVEEVQTLAENRGIHHVPIVERGKLLGMVCTCDLRSASASARVLQLARRNVVTAKPDCSAAEVAQLMRDNVIGSVLISNGDGLWGTVARNDLAEADSELAASLASLECVFCHSTQHLRQTDSDSLICVTCSERAGASHWFDEGSGD